ncbi:MAG: hypothetical protein QM627_12710 [Luteolibacter sp.]
MLKRLILESWSEIMAVVAFFFTAAVFCYTSIRALKLSKERREALANLPLQSGKDEE